MCGEKSRCGTFALQIPGSPPRVRGKGPCHHPVIFVDRITPAYAGKRASASPAPSVPWDHPRVYGEKLARLYSSVPVPGSPPRVRGKATNAGSSGRAAGITPAYAGKSCRAVRSRWRARDHPRVCGEKQGQKDSIINQLGSPPRVQGKVWAL